ncbi:HAD family hydrolase [Corynebacterium aquilae]|uniref:HAD family hydrolase n=1 Tax=Corynebacterium aquilae DSM 44791 TaxID=1431546 RepID=A0A1L7CEE7_9CORY|nr:HAD-IA family hydrolase [Corynebacterium aquilae]APT84198.1 HAD family hydrolase [Corynebacterium aquilae DSM 44791]
MRGLIVDYCGVLDGTDEDVRRWKALLSELKAHGVQLAILSNTEGEGPLADEIRRWLSDGIVDAVALSGEIGAEKPETAAFEIAARSIGLPMNDCVFVDDNILNVRGAVDSGLVGVFYQHFDRSVVEICGMFGMDGEY